MTVRTILRMLARPGCEQQFTDAWRRAADVIATVPGQLGQELMRESGDAPWFAIVSDWSSREAVDAFGRSAARETLTEALRDLREDAARSTYEVLATVPARPQQVVRVEIGTSAGPGEAEELEAAWSRVAPSIQSAEGNLLETLVREEGSQRYRVASEWRCEADFMAWVADPVHAEHAMPMRRWYSADFRKETFDVRQPDVRDTSFSSADDADGAVRVEVSATVPAQDQDEFEERWRALASFMHHQEGNLLEELLRSQDGTTYRACSEWRSPHERARSSEGSEHVRLVEPLLRWFSTGPGPQEYLLRHPRVRDSSYRPTGTDASTRPVPVP